MQSGQSGQFKLDQAGLIKAAPVALIVGAVTGALYIIFSLWSIASILGWVVPIFGGVWYVMTVRKSGTMPDQMNGLVNGAIMGALVGLAHNLLALITSPIGLNSALGGFGGFGASLLGGVGISGLFTGLLFGAIGGAAGAWVYSYMVSSGQVK